MKRIALYNGMGEFTHEVEGTISSRDSVSEGWEIVTIVTIEGKTLVNQYISTAEVRVAAE